MEIKEILKKMIERLKPVDPYKIILYGEYGGKKETLNKGIKLLVILDSDVIQEPEERARKNFEVMTENIGMDDYKRYNMSVVVQTRGDNEKDKQREDFFICEIEKTGKVIYEKYK